MENANPARPKSSEKLTWRERRAFWKEYSVLNGFRIKRLSCISISFIAISGVLTTFVLVSFFCFGKNVNGLLLFLANCLLVVSLSITIKLQKSYLKWLENTKNITTAGKVVKTLLRRR